MINSAQSSNPTHQNSFPTALRNFCKSFSFKNTENVSRLDRNTAQRSLRPRTQSTKSSSRNDKEAAHSKPWHYDSEGFSRAQTRIAMEASIRTFETDNEKRLENEKRLKSVEPNQTALDHIIDSPPREEYASIKNSGDDSHYNQDTDPIINMVVTFRSEHRPKTQNK